MKTKIYLAFSLLIIFASCSSLQQTSSTDDIYYSPKDEVVVLNERHSNPTYSNQKVVIDKNLDEQIASVIEDDTKKDVDTLLYENEDDSYNSLVVDNYNEALERRRNAIFGGYYGLNNTFIVHSDAFWSASFYANDPYYNLVIVGDQVWVEPRWISASFGYRPHISYYSPWSYSYYSYYYDPFYYNLHYGYSYPYYSYYGYPYYSSYYNNNHYIGSGIYTNNRRGLGTGSYSSLSPSSRRSDITEVHTGQDVRRSSSVKSGLDRRTTTVSGRQAVTPRETGRSNVATTRERTNTSLTRTTRTSATQRTQTAVRRTETARENTTRSTYSRTGRSSSTRYNRPASTTARRDDGNTSRTRTSTYSPNRSSSGNSTVRSGSSSTRRSSGSSVRSGSSGSKSSSSGSSSRSSSGSSSRRSGGGRR